jgi:hypothetical protein
MMYSLRDIVNFTKLISRYFKAKFRSNLVRIIFFLKKIRPQIYIMKNIF